MYVTNVILFNDDKMNPISTIWCNTWSLIYTSHSPRLWGFRLRIVWEEPVLLLTHCVGWRRRNTATQHVTLTGLHGHIESLAVSIMFCYLTLVTWWFALKNLISLGLADKLGWNEVVSLLVLDLMEKVMGIELSRHFNFKSYWLIG